MKKRVLITGASRGIGLETAKTMLENGWSVIGTRNKSPFPKKLTTNEHFQGIQVDLSDSKALEVIKPFFSGTKMVDVLVNNAGIFEPVLFSDSDKKWQENWSNTIQVNLMSAAQLCKWAVQGWTEAGKFGVIINVSSRAAYRGETAEYSSYAASKAALVGLTKTIARGFGKKNIVAYTVAPGFVKTEMAENSIEVYGEDYLTKDLVLNEIIPPEEVARLINTLAKGDLRHMTGSTLHMNSGSYMI